MQLPVPSKFSIAGKVFLLGEYAVLAERPALVASVGPRFSLSVSEETPNAVETFHPESPAGLLWKSLPEKPDWRFKFDDPFNGAGGFGASSAQFALLYRLLADEMDWDLRWESVYRVYRELTSRAEIPPSGADVVAQWRGGVTFFDPGTAEENHVPHALDLWPIFNWSDLLIFSATGQAGRKTATHDHLRDLARKGILKPESTFAAELEKPLLGGIGALREGDTKSFGLALTDYAEMLARFGLEHPAAQSDRLALSQLQGVLGVKGTGALLSDSVVVLLDAKLGDHAQVIAAAEARGLKLVAEGLSSQLGAAAC